MRRHHTNRRQIKLEGVNQITSPSQLEVGMHIGVIAILEPSSRPIRGLRALAAGAISYGRKEGESRLAAAKNGWQFNDGALFPQWRGTVQNILDDGLWAEVSGAPDDKNPFRYINQGPESLPDITEPTKKYDTYENMGLAVVRASNVTFGDEAGRWLPAATVLLD